MSELLNAEQMKAAKRYIQGHQASTTAVKIHAGLEEMFGMKLPYCILVCALIDVAVTQDDLDREQSNRDFLLMAGKK